MILIKKFWYRLRDRRNIEITKSLLKKKEAGNFKKNLEGYFNE